MCAPTRDRTPNLDTSRMMLQSTEPFGQGLKRLLSFILARGHFFIAFLEREEERRESEGEGEKQCKRETSTGCLIGDRTYHLGICPGWELNPQPLSLWDDAPTN